MFRAADRQEHRALILPVGAGGPVIRDPGRIIFDRAIDDIITLDFLLSIGRST